jgi:hypothetical protein
VSTVRTKISSLGSVAAIAMLVLVSACVRPTQVNDSIPSSSPSLSGSNTVTPTSTEPRPPAGPPNPCELITDEAAATAGVTVKTRQLEKNPPSPRVPTEQNCIMFDTIDRYILVFVSEGGRADYDFYRNQHAIETSFRDIPGLGDAAHAISTNAVVLTGDYVVAYGLQIFDMADTIQQERVIALARAGTTKIIN